MIAYGLSDIFLLLFYCYYLLLFTLFPPFSLLPLLLLPKELALSCIPPLYNMDLVIVLLKFYLF